MGATPGLTQLTVCAGREIKELPAPSSCCCSWGLPLLHPPPLTAAGCSSCRGPPDSPRSILMELPGARLPGPMTCPLLCLCHALETLPKVTIFSPRQPWFYGWGFNLRRGQALLEKWNLIPEGVDILITHGPPLGKACGQFLVRLPRLARMPTSLEDGGSVVWGPGLAFRV